MLLATRRRLIANKVEARTYRARNTHAFLGANLHHTVLSMSFAIRCPLAALNIEARPLGAEIM